MKKQIAVSILVAALLCSCSSTRVVTMDSRATYFERINKRGQNRNVRIFQLDGRSYSGRDIHLEPDSCAWTDPETSLSRTIPTATIRRIVFTKRLKGMYQGLFIGYGLGYLVGLIAASTDSEPGGDGDSDLRYLILPIAGGPLGALVGGAIGSRDIYIFSKPAAQSP